MSDSSQNQNDNVKKPNDHLFINKNGQPLQMCISRTTHGGAVTENEKTAFILLADPGRSYSRIMHSTQWVSDCIQQDRLIEHDTPEYRLKSVHKVFNTKYTLEDDRLLRSFVEKKKSEGAKINGNIIYQELAATHDQHSYHSWRDRAVNILRITGDESTYAGSKVRREEQMRKLKEKRNKRSKNINPVEQMDGAGSIIGVQPTEILDSERGISPVVEDNHEIKAKLDYQTQPATQEDPLSQLFSDISSDDEEDNFHRREADALRRRRNNTEASQTVDSLIPKLEQLYNTTPSIIDGEESDSNQSDSRQLNSKISSDIRKRRLSLSPPKVAQPLEIEHKTKSRNTRLSLPNMNRRDQKSPPTHNFIELLSTRSIHQSSKPSFEGSPPLADLPIPAEKSPNRSLRISSPIIATWRNPPQSDLSIPNSLPLTSPVADSKVLSKALDSPQSIAESDIEAENLVLTDEDDVIIEKAVLEKMRNSTTLPTTNISRSSIDIEQSGDPKPMNIPSPIKTASSRKRELYREKENNPSPNEPDTEQPESLQDVEPLSELPARQSSRLSRRPLEKGKHPAGALFERSIAKPSEPVALETESSEELNFSRQHGSLVQQTQNHISSKPRDTTLHFNNGTDSTTSIYLNTTKTERPSNITDTNHELTESAPKIQGKNGNPTSIGIQKRPISTEDEEEEEPLMRKKRHSKLHQPISKPIETPKVKPAGNGPEVDAVQEYYTEGLGSNASTANVDEDRASRERLLLYLRDLYRSEIRTLVMYELVPPLKAIDILDACSGDLKLARKFTNDGMTVCYPKKMSPTTPPVSSATTIAAKPTRPDHLQLRLMTDNDKAEVARLFCETFRREPLGEYNGVKDDEAKSVASISVDDPVSFVVEDTLSHRLVAFRTSCIYTAAKIAASQKKNYEEGPSDSVQAILNKMQGLWVERTTIFKSKPDAKVMKFIALGVDSKYEGLGLAKELLNAALSKSKELKCDAVMVVASAFATQHLFKNRLGFEEIARVRYSDFTWINKEKGGVEEKPFENLHEPEFLMIFEKKLEY
ncbi:hypothetical protein BGZ76_008762 [Entomortierella beljakovae]|nr:hypothetical protein BGZ76_008762 [Entomortierella beljakovae]